MSDMVNVCIPSGACVANILSSDGRTWDPTSQGSTRVRVNDALESASHCIAGDTIYTCTV
jgi:hypothetical protein